MHATEATLRVTQTGLFMKNLKPGFPLVTQAQERLCNRENGLDARKISTSACAYACVRLRCVKTEQSVSTTQALMIVQ